MPYRDLEAVRARHEALLARLAEIDARRAEARALDAEAPAVRAELDKTRAILDGARPKPKLPLLQSVGVASPCRERWDDMDGDDRARFCGKCQKNVYNLSAMTEADAEALLAANGEACVRFYRRADGTVMTADCPVGARRKRVRRVAAAAAAVGALAAAASALATRATMGAVAPRPGWTTGAVAMPIPAPPPPSPR